MFGLKLKINKIGEVLSGMWEYNHDSMVIKPPREMIINLTYWCNSRCIMCNIWKKRPKNEMGLSDWKKVVGDPVFANLRSLTISGGEPTMHPEFLEIVTLFIDSWPKLKNLSLITNGFMVDRVVGIVDKLAQLCRRSGVNLGVSVSLDGAVGVHEKVRRISDGFRKTTETILRLKKLQRKYSFGLGSGSIIVRQNINDLQKIERWYCDNGIDHSYQIVGFHDTFVDNLDTRKGVDYLAKDQKLLLSILEGFSKPKGLFDFRSYYWRDMLEMYRDKKPRRTPCPFRVNQMVLDSLGDVFYCLSVRPIGNFLKERRGIWDIYSDKKSLDFRKKMIDGPCVRCNSGCNVTVAIASDFWKYLFYRITGRI